MRRVRNFLAAGLLVFSLGGVVATSSVAYADSPKQIVCDSIGAGTDCAEDPNNGVTVNKIIQVTLNILSILVGVTAVIMIMVSGFKYITAGGDASKVSSAKNTLIYALIGIAVAALAQFLVQYVFSKITAPPAPARQVENTNGFIQTFPGSSAVSSVSQAYGGVEHKA